MKKSINHLSSIGFGAAPLGGLYGNAVGEKEASLMIREALAANITFFDTSPYYNNSEICLGNALKGIPRDTYALCTKGGRISEDIFDFSPKTLNTNFERSLKRLNTDYVDVFLLHDVEFVDDSNFNSVIMETALPYLYENFKKNGKALLIGFSCLPLSTIENALAHPNSKLIDIILTYSHNTLVDNTLNTIKTQLDNNDILLLDASLFNMGLLTTNGGPEWHPVPPILKKACKKIVEELQKNNSSLTLEQIALSYAYRNCIASCMIVGCRTLNELRDNIFTIKNHCDKNQIIEENVKQYIFNQLI